MSQVQDHYCNLLAAHYSWMNGMPFEEKVAEQRVLLTSLGIGMGSKGLAIDLGAGPGYQAHALGEIGFETILALDTSRPLLDELEAANDRYPIRAILADLRDFPTFVEKTSVDAVVCMGDTLTHLNDLSDVWKLFQDAHEVLRSDGRLALTFRDLSTELTGLDRFLPIRADDQRIMTCALEYEPDCVVVTDLIHIHAGNGWTLHKSSYRKLRLDSASVTKELAGIGFVVDHDGAIGGMRVIAARKL